jgi:hypothetical protein
LDKTLAVAALALGLALRRLGDATGAARALGNAQALFAASPPSELVPLADGQCAGRLLMTVDLQIQLLQRSP